MMKTLGNNVWLHLHIQVSEKSGEWAIGEDPY